MAHVARSYLVPEQLLPVQLEREMISPERALLAAILEEACHVAGTRTRGWNRPAARAWQRLRQETLAWMASNDRGDLCAFLTICDQVGLDAGTVRRRYGLAPEGVNAPNQP